MDFELEPATQAGRRFAALCEKHAPDFFARAAAHDREGSFPHEDIADLIASGAIAATVPEELGGFGVASARDFAAAMSRLGRGDGSITLAMNMHYLVTWSMARGWRAARAGGAQAQEAALAGMLREVVAGKRILSVLATENGIPIMQPMATAVREGEGWRLNGRKHFATGSPAATHFAVRLRYQDEQGAWRFGGATVAKDAPGVVLLDNWDALGMRGSGSGEVTFENCFIPLAGVADAGAWGEMSPQYLTLVSAAFPLVLGTFIGIAELARSLSLRQIAQRKRGMCRPSGTSSRKTRSTSRPRAACSRAMRLSSIAHWRRIRSPSPAKAAARSLPTARQPSTSSCARRSTSSIAR
jgi:alkylation response protein AidB-like acyl-CoA dehydrogenase